LLWTNYIPVNVFVVPSEQRERLFHRQIRRSDHFNKMAFHPESEVPSSGVPAVGKVKRWSEDFIGIRHATICEMHFDPVQINMGSVASSRSVVGFFESEVLQGANYYQQERANSEYGRKEGEGLFNFNSPVIGRFIFFFGLLFGFSSIPFIFSGHGWVTPIGLLFGGLLIISGAYPTSADRRSENVVVEAIIVAKLELCNVTMQIFLVGVVESADDPAPDSGPQGEAHA
jgi:hypothetical protein